MAQFTFSGTTGTIGNLNANFTDLYSLREAINQAGTYTASAPKIYLDANGSGSIRISPFGWGSSQAAWDVGNIAGIASDSTTTYLTSNSYFDGTNYKAKQNAVATRIIMDTGVLAFAQASAVAGGATQTFTEAWRTDSVGRFLLGTASSLATTSRMAIKYSGAGSEFGLTMQPVANTTTQISFLNAAGTQVGSITETISSTAFNTSSDYRLKTAIEAMSHAYAVGVVRSIPWRRFEFKFDPGRKADGVIAHELQDVYPAAVFGDKDGQGMQQVDYSKLVPILGAALQNALDRIEALEARQ